MTATDPIPAGPLPPPRVPPAVDRPLPSPGGLRERLPLCATARATVERGRREVEDVLAGRDDRLLVIAGPCSLHDRESALAYARRLAERAEAHRDRLVVLMRCYVEKPRTTLGWKGLVHDPALDGHGDLALGLERARSLLLEIARLGLPCGTELLDPIVARYLDDLPAWASIGARTVHSQIHRELASGYPAPVGFKNATDGDVQPAIDAVTAARAPHAALSLGPDGRVVATRTAGNGAGHVVLRGGRLGPNADRATIEATARSVARGADERPVLVDCSHGNSGKDPERQPEVARAVTAPRPLGLAGLLLESNLRGGRQEWTPGTRPEPGLSITDGCLGWGATERLLELLAAAPQGLAADPSAAR